MNEYLKPVTERLYLCKDVDNEIYIDLKVQQYHIDSIRFLYKQFKKRIPGVIINNPLGYGNSMLVALFLGAIRKLLNKPILILCDKNDESNWLEHFQQLTQCCDAVVTEAETPFLKKFIFINTMQRLEQFCRRDWGVIVVDNDAFLKEKTLQTKFKADFKIWITPVDMKDHLQTFASIFKWLNPKEKLNIDDFKAKPGDMKDTVAKSVLLDSFLRDFVSRTQLLASFEPLYVKPEETACRSKKNKDATGTKIKRSKKLPSEDAGTSNGILVNCDIEVGASAAKIPKRVHDGDTPVKATGDFSVGNFNNNFILKHVIDSTKSDMDMDVESFIRNEKPISCHPFKEDDDSISYNNESRTDSIELEIFDTTDKLNGNDESDTKMDIISNQESCADVDTNSKNGMAILKPFDESHKGTTAREYVGERDQATPEWISDKIINEIEEDKSHARYFVDNNYIKPEEPVKTEESKKLVVESPKKDLNSKLMDMDKEIFKKFQGSLLDRLF